MGLLRALGRSGFRSLRSGDMFGQPLPMDEASRMARAIQMGFSETPMYRGQRSSSPAFTKVDGIPVTFVSESPEFASRFGDHVLPLRIRGDMFNPRDPNHVNRLISQVEKELDLEGLTTDGKEYYLNRLLADLQWATRPAQDNWREIEHYADAIKRAGFSGFRMSEDANVTYGVFEPRNIRSRFARFNPAESDSSDLMAAVPMAVGGGGLLSALHRQRQEA